MTDTIRCFIRYNDRSPLLVTDDTLDSLMLMKMRMKMHLGKRNVPRLIKWFALLAFISYLIYLVNRVLSFHLVVNSVVYLSSDDQSVATTVIREKKVQMKRLNERRSSRLIGRVDRVNASFHHVNQCQPKKHIMFLKTHKTGSSSVQNIFLRYGDDHDLFFALPKPDNYIGHPTRFNRRLLLDPALLKSRYNVTYSMIVHHLRFNYKELNEIMPKDTFYLTILRDPVKLYESLFTYFDFPQMLLGKNISLLQFTQMYKSQLAEINDEDDEEIAVNSLLFNGQNDRNSSKSPDSRQYVLHGDANNGHASINTRTDSIDTPAALNAIASSAAYDRSNTTASSSSSSFSSSPSAPRHAEKQIHLQGNSITPKALVTDDKRDVNNEQTRKLTTRHGRGRENQVISIKSNQATSTDQLKPVNVILKSNKNPHSRHKRQMKISNDDEEALDGSSVSAAFLPYLTGLLEPLWSASKDNKVTKSKSNVPDINRRIRGRYGRNQMAFDLGFNPRYFDRKQFVRNFIDALDSIFHLVMINEKMDESLILLKHLLCWSLDDIISFEHNRRSPDFMLKQPISGENEKIIRSLNSADQLIYNHFYDKLIQMINAFGVEKMASEVHLLRQKRKLLYDKCVQSTDVMSNIVPQQSSIVSKYHSTVKNHSLVSSSFTHSRSGKKINPLWASPKVLGMKMKPQNDQSKLCTQLTMRELTYTAKLRKKQGQLLSSKKLVLSGFNVKLEVLAQNQVDYYFRN